MFEQIYRGYIHVHVYDYYSHTLLCYIYTCSRYNNSSPNISLMMYMYLKLPI